MDFLVFNKIIAPLSRETECEATARPDLFRRIKPGRGSLPGERTVESWPSNTQQRERESTFPYRLVVYVVQSAGKGLGGLT